MSNGRKNRGDKEAPFRLRRPELIEAESAPVDLPKTKAPPRPDLSGIGAPAPRPRKKAEPDLVPVQGPERKKSTDPDMIPITGHGLAGAADMVEGEAGTRKGDADMVGIQAPDKKADADLARGRDADRKAGGDLTSGAPAIPRQGADLARGRERGPKKDPDVVSAAGPKRRSGADMKTTEREPRPAADLVRGRQRGPKKDPDIVSAPPRRRGADAEMSSAEREARSAADFVRNQLRSGKKGPDMVSAADLKRRGTGAEMHKIEREPRAAADLVRGRHRDRSAGPSIVRSTPRPAGTSAGQIVRDVTRRRGAGPTLVRQPGGPDGKDDPATVLQGFVDELREAAERNRVDVEIVLLSHMTVDFAKGHRTLRVTFPVTELTYDRVRIRDSTPPPSVAPAEEPEPEDRVDTVRETAGLLARFGNMLKRRTQLDKATDAPVDVVAPTAARTATEAGPPRHTVALTARYIDPAKHQDWIVELISDRLDPSDGALPKVAPPGRLTSDGLKRRFLPLLGSLLTALDAEEAGGGVATGA